MTIFSPKIEIINHFDNLINRIDIDIDSSLEKFNDQILKDLQQSSLLDRKRKSTKYDWLFAVKAHKKDNLITQMWSESIKVTDYLKQIRMRTIEELKKEQEETLETYKLNVARFKNEKFYFQVEIKLKETQIWAFNVFTIVTDFYMSQSDIESLEKLVNEEIEAFPKYIVFDEKIVLIGLVYNYFLENLLLKIPNHVIHVSKQDVKIIETFNVSGDFIEVNLTSSEKIDLSKIEYLRISNQKFKEFVEVKIDSLSSVRSLKLHYHVKENFSLNSKYDNYSLEEIKLHGTFSYLNLDKFMNLKKLSLFGNINNKSFNFEFFKNLSNQLEELRIHFYFTLVDEETFLKMFEGRHFTKLKYLYLWECCCMKNLKKNFIDRFQTLEDFRMNKCGIESIEADAFSNLTQLTYIDLSFNSIKSIGKNAFSNLNILEGLNLNDNQLTHFDAEFNGLGNSEIVGLNNNKF